MIPENLPKSVILHKSEDKNFNKLASLLLKWNVIVHETKFLSEIKDQDILYDIPIALAIANREDTSGIDFLRSMMHANLLIQRMMLSASVDIEMFEFAINKAHINYFSKLPIEETSFAIYLQKANKRFRKLTEPLIKYSTLQKVTEELLVDRERYRQEAKIDSLTMLMNRRSFDSIIQRIWNRFKDKGAVFSLAIFDIDHFKKVNDTFGHSAGDEVLKNISEIILNNLRLGMDYAFRYGGEEFAIISTDTNHVEMNKLLERILNVVRESTFQFGNDEISVTFSGGTCQAKYNETVELLIEHADKALYKAKNAGRNQIIDYEVLVNK